MDININLGALASPTDPRRWDLGTFQQPIATPAVYRPDVSQPFYYQGSQPACGGHSGAKFQNHILIDSVTLSPRFVYSLCKLVDGLPVESGTYMAAIFKVLKTYGVSSSSTFPNDISLSHPDYANYKAIPQSAYDDAKQRKISSYAFLSDVRFDTIKQAIYQNKAVLLLIWLDEGWFHTTTPTFTTKRWGHFVVAVGYDEDNIYIVDSTESDTTLSIKAINSKYSDFIREGGTVIEATNQNFSHNFQVDMKMGQTSSEIAALQQALRLDGEFTYPQNTGYYGEITRQAVHAFQVKHGIPDSGTNGTIVGPKTRSTLNQYYNHV